jgi:hypothetical protein
MGPTGDTGPQGLTGPTGPQGLSGIVGSNYAAESFSSNTPFGIQLQLGKGVQTVISPLVSVTVGAGQSVYVSASSSLQPIGGNGNATVGAHIVYQAQGDTALTDAGSADLLTTLTTTTPGYTPVSVSAVLSGLAPGNYEVGMGARVVGLGSVGTAGPPTIYADDGSTSALVFQS